MRSLILLAAASTLAAGTARAANMCQADTLSCSTTMPPGGYCECTAHGATQGGTVVNRPATHQKANATPGGCSTRSSAPGCTGPK